MYFIHLKSQGLVYESVVGNPVQLCIHSWVHFGPEFYSGGVVKHIYHIGKCAFAALCHNEFTTVSNKEKKGPNPHQHNSGPHVDS